MKLFFRPYAGADSLDYAARPFPPRTPAASAGVARITFSRFLIRTLLLVLGMLCMTAGLYAQAVAVAQVEGTVTDPTAKFIVGAQVTMTNTDTKALHATVSEADGHYVLSNLPPGPYSLEAKAPGFKDYRQSGIVLEVAHNISINVQMTVGAVTETIRSLRERGHGGNQGQRHRAGDG